MSDALYGQVNKNREVYYLNVVFIVCKLMGFYIKTEYHTSHGRINLVLQTDKYVYIIEFLFGDAEYQAMGSENSWKSCPGVHL